jgi:hypothetical protein
MGQGDAWQKEADRRAMEGEGRSSREFAGQEEENVT